MTFSISPPARGGLRMAGLEGPVSRTVPRLLLPVLLLALVACGRSPEAPPPEGEDPALATAPEGEAEAIAPGADEPPLPEAEQDFERQWLGVLPCTDCEGIETRLTLRHAGGEDSFLLEETYLGGEGESRFETRGPWRREADGLLRLDPDGLGLRLRTREDGSLELVDAEGAPLSDGPDYRLGRI